MSYPGGKAGAGVYQTLINLMPPHRIYIEPFLGAGAVLRRKRPAAHNIGLDLNEQLIADWRAEYDARANFEFVRGCGLEFIKRSNFAGDELIYLDPPYLRETRASSATIYKHHLAGDEFTERQHRALLEAIKGLRCMVMISGYASELYERELAGWRSVTYEAMTRAGRKATEYVWLNFPETIELHDYTYFGAGYRDRWRIEKKRRRWLAKLKAMPPQEARAILAAIQEWRGL